MSVAGELAAKLEGFVARGKGGNFWDVIGVKTGSLDSWREYGQLIALWREVEATLSALEANGRVVAHFRPALVPTMLAIVNPDRQWGSGQQSIGDVTTAINLLRALDDLLRFVEGDLTAVTEADRATLRSTLDEAQSLLEDNEVGLDGNEQQHVFLLLAELRRLLDEKSTLGQADLRASVERLNGALAHIAANLVHQGRGRSALRVLGVIGKIGSAVRLIAADIDVMLRLGLAGAQAMGVNVPELPEGTRDALETLRGGEE